VNPHDFVRSHTAIGHHPLVPEVRLHLASEITPIWQATEAWLHETGTSPPFWAFAWPGSAAMARHILDNPQMIEGQRVLDFASGCGLAAIACALTGAGQGATQVEAAEIDPLARAAIEVNAALNEVSVEVLGDVVGAACRWDLILCGDVCYEAPMTGLILPWLRQMAASAEVWIADPGRAYLPAAGLSKILQMTVPTSPELEDRTERTVTLWHLDPG